MSDEGSNDIASSSTADIRDHDLEQRELGLVQSNDNARLQADR